MENLKLLFQIYLRPGHAFSELIDRGSWLAAALLVLLVSFLFSIGINSKMDAMYRIPTVAEYYKPSQFSDDEDPKVEQAAYDQAMANYQKAVESRLKIPVVGDYFFRFYSFDPSAFYRPVLSISIFYVPALILLVCSLAPLGSFGLLLRRDYATLAICTMMAWVAASLPFAIIGFIVFDPTVLLALWTASGLLFWVFMVFAIRTVFGIGYFPAAISTIAGSLGFTLGMYAFHYISPWLFSPFILFYAISYFGGEVRGVGTAYRQRQNFKRFLHNATVNPKDADAHVQLGLIYLQRRQEAKAIDHFKKAIEIDPAEIDANYELGKLARERGELQDALDHFAVVLEQDDKHSLSEVWREVGATYLAAGMFNEARERLETFTERRAYDPEGLYYLGKALKASGEPERAREAFEKAVESVKSSVEYRRRSVKHWGKLAEKEM
jgi:hypothetical protein